MFIVLSMCVNVEHSLSLSGIDVFQISQCRHCMQYKLVNFNMVGPKFKIVAMKLRLIWLIDFYGDFYVANQYFISNTKECQ